MNAAPAPAGVKTKHVLKAVMTSDLDQLSRHIMHVLASIADYQTSELPPQFTPSTTQLIRQTGMSESSVVRSRKKLEAAGWIVLKRPTLEESYRRVRIRYQLAIPPTGAHRAHAEAAQRLIQGLADDPPAPDPADDDYPADIPTGSMVNDPEASVWLPRGVSQTPVGVSDSHPSDPTGVTQPSPRVSQGHPDGCLTDTSKNYLPTYQEPLKPPAGAGDRAQRLPIAEELADKFWRIHGTGYAQRRPAVRAVIITAVADNAVPRDDAARALDALARAGKQITADSLTAALARIRGQDPARAAPAPEPSPRPPVLFCPVHTLIALTGSGICLSCAGDFKAAPDEFDEPPDPRVPPPRHAHHPDEDNTLTWKRENA